MSQLFASSGQSIGDSASGLVLTINFQGWFPLGLTGWIFLHSKGLLRVFSRTIVQKASILHCSAFFMVQLSCLYMTTVKTIALPIRTLSAKWCLCFFSMPPHLAITFLPRSKHLLILWLQSPSAVILETKIKSVIVSTVFPSSFHEVMGSDVHFLNVEF